MGPNVPEVDARAKGILGVLSLALCAAPDAPQRRTPALVQSDRCGRGGILARGPGRRSAAHGASLSLSLSAQGVPRALVLALGKRDPDQDLERFANVLHSMHCLDVD